ncbi:MAG: alpha/beta hydrolase [Phycisphaerae bacterium]|jgi:acetyl esterase/lipase|nr:alpha/beta hydrolase [Phycisphaerae bacterium]
MLQDKTSAIVKSLIACCLIAVLASATTQVAAEDMKLWPDGVPGAKGTAVTDTPTLKLFAAPKDLEGPLPAVLLIPGGGYKHISGYGTFWDFFKTRPVRFFSMKYRLPVNGYRHPAPLQDAQRAVRLIRANAKKWNIDPKKVVVVAFSSGGHVAATLATQDHAGKKDAKDPVERFSCRPDFMALFCPVVSMKNKPHKPSVARLLGPNPDKKLIDSLSAELQVDADTPPTFLAHARNDTLVPPENSTQFHRALRKAKVDTELRLYPEGGHGVTNKTNPWKMDLENWLNRCGLLKDKWSYTYSKKQPYEPDSHYTLMNIEGWKVKVNNGLLPGGRLAATGAKAIAGLKSHMIKLKKMVRPEGIKKFQTVTFWLELDSTNGPHGRTSAYQYHPGLDWLKKMDFNPKKVKCVEYGNAASLARRPFDRGVTVLLHEYAHAYHDNFLSFNHKEIIAAYKRCVNGDTYPKRDWVKSNHKEFFAGVTTRYHGTKEEREALVKRDPILAKLLLKIWGKPLGFIDSPDQDK